MPMPLCALGSVASPSFLTMGRIRTVCQAAEAASSALTAASSAAFPANTALQLASSALPNSLVLPFSPIGQLEDLDRHVVGAGRLVRLAGAQGSQELLDVERTVEIEAIRVAQ